jgi:putative transposase
MTFHVCVKSVAEARLARDDSDRECFLTHVQTVVGAFGWSCLAVCLLDTHYHLLLTISEANLSRGMQRLNGSYAQFFNRKYERKGHLFGARYYGGPVLTQAHLLATLRYVARNALDVGADPAHYRWSSYPGVIGTRPCWPFIAKARVLELFGPPQIAVRLLRAFVEDDAPPGAMGAVAAAAARVAAGVVGVRPP